MALVLVTPPTEDVFTLAQVRDHLKCGTEEDDYLSRISKAAVSITENMTKRRIAPQTWKQTYHSFPGRFVLELAPVRSITSVKYTNDQAVVTTLSGFDYREDLKNDPAIIYTASNTTEWPDDVHEDYLNTVEVTYSVGYNIDAEEDDPLALPEDLKQAIAYMIGHLYANRELAVVGAGIVSANVPMTYDFMITPYRRFLF